MHYYKFNIADYRKDTGHLSLVEHGVYRQLLDTYYLDEKPIETQLVIRRLGIRTEEEKNALENVLADFFKKTDCGEFYIHARVFDEIAKYQDKAETARVNGSKGGRPEKPKKTQSVNSGNPKKTKSKANQELINHKPITNNTNFSADEIKDLFNGIIGESEENKVGSIRGLTAKRFSSLKARISESAVRSELSWWERFFRYLTASDFLMGRSEPDANTGRVFCCDFDWIMKPDNMIKILEKKYHEGAQNAQ